MEGSRGEFILDVRVIRLWKTLVRVFQFCVLIEPPLSKDKDFSSPYKVLYGSWYSEDIPQLECVSQHDLELPMGGPPS